MMTYRPNARFSYSCTWKDLAAVLVATSKVRLSSLPRIREDEVEGERDENERERGGEDIEREREGERGRERKRGDKRRERERTGDREK